MYKPINLMYAFMAGAELIMVLDWAKQGAAWAVFWGLLGMGFILSCIKAMPLKRKYK